VTEKKTDSFLKNAGTCHTNKGTLNMVAGVVLLTAMITFCVHLIWRTGEFNFIGWGETEGRSASFGLLYQPRMIDDDDGDCGQSTE
jgi:hypothetical protein